MIKRGIAGLICLYSVCLALLIVGQPILSGRSHLLELVYLTLPFLFFPAIIVVCWAIIAKSRVVWASVLLLLVLFFWRWGGLFTPRLMVDQAADLAIASFNLGPGIATVDGKEQFLRQLEADLLVLMELTPDIEPVIKASLSEQYLFSAQSDKEPTILLLSKLEIFSVGEIWPEGHGGRSYLHAQIAGSGGSNEVIHLLMIHPAPPDILRTGPLPVGIDNQRNQERFADLVAYIERLEGPVILAGDFNVSAEAEVYRGLTQILIDAHVIAGQGFGFTFPVYHHRGQKTWFPVVRIDYIFHSPHFVTVASETVCETPSDHCLLRVDLAYRP